MNENNVSFDLALDFALRENARREMEQLPRPSELETMYPDMSALDAKLSALLEKMKSHKHRVRPARIIRKALLVAAIAMALFSCLMLASSDVRNAVVNTIIEWTNRDMGIRFEIQGDPLTALPDGYGPHYIPEGLVFNDAASATESDGSFYYAYQSEDGSKALDIQVRILQNGSMTWMDNEHTTYDKITFNGAKAYLGTFQKHKGYVMIWASDGVENTIYAEGNISLSDIYKIAENLY
ncbi:hypothetical protein SDC9_147720 [bioreactor metagenome]|uniref:DUF4367 domain-containing protein n=1 Tax=bioreactor metagenome TaxID=1076179 RepID=A0A645EEQ3_9ZZZZ|nr:DUF4367 domain-containing protein [Oscillospiraceae bacterium]